MIKKHIYNCNIIDIIINIMNYIIWFVISQIIMVYTFKTPVSWSSGMPFSVLFRISQKSVAFLATGV